MLILYRVCSNNNLSFQRFNNKVKPKLRIRKCEMAKAREVISIAHGLKTIDRRDYLHKVTCLALLCFKPINTG